MTFEEIVDHALALLQRRGRVAYRTLKRQFTLDDEALEDLKAEIIKAQRLGVDEDGEVLVWTGGAGRPPAPATEPVRAPHTYTPPHLAEKILLSKVAPEGERKQVTVLFADLRGSLELLADRDPEEARQAPRPGAGADDGGRAPLRRDGEPGHGRRDHGPVWGANRA